MVPNSKDLKSANDGKEMGHASTPPPTKLIRAIPSEYSTKPQKSLGEGARWICEAIPTSQ